MVSFSLNDERKHVDYVVHVEFCLFFTSFSTILFGKQKGVFLNCHSIFIHVGKVIPLQYQTKMNMWQKTTKYLGLE